MTNSRVFGFTALFVVLLLALVNTMVVRSSNHAPDDAYISLRYAENLASGHGLRFNPGGEPVEGFSSPLHVVTMAAMIKMGGDPRAVSQFSSLSAALLTILMVTLWGQRRLGIFWGSAAGVAVALNQGFSMWARGGLETTLFTLLLLLAMMVAVDKRWLIMGLLAGLLALTRPEGVLYWLPLFAHAALVQRGDNRPLRELVPSLVIALAILGAWVMFRLAYFHDVLPNTYYAKMDGVRWAQVQRGGEYIQSFIRLSENQVSLALIGLGGILFLWRNRTRTALDWRSWQVLGLGLLGCTVFFTLSAGGDWMHQHRFLQPAVPVLMLLVAWAGKYLGEMGRSRPGKALLAVTVVLVFLSQPLRIFSHDLRHPNPALAWPPGLIQPWDGYSNPYLNYHLGLQMREIMPTDATVALIPVGAFGYSCGRTVIDMLGLNDREIAHQPSVAIGKGRMGHEKGDGNLILARRPDFILLRGNPNPTLDEVAPPDEELGKYIPIRQIWNSESFQKNYEPFVVKVDAKYSFTVYRRIARESMTSEKESRWNSSSTL